MRLLNFLLEIFYQLTLKLQWGGHTCLTIQWKILLSALRVYEDYVSQAFCSLKKKKKKKGNYPVVFGMWQPVASHSV